MSDTAGLARGKQLVVAFHDAIDDALVAAHDQSADAAAVIGAAIAPHVGDSYGWRGVYPFYEQDREGAVAVFYAPLAASFRRLQRRPMVFLAGYNDVDHDPGSLWVFEMGQLVGLHDRPWLDIPATGKLTTIRYAQFHRVENDAIAETAVFIDLLGVMRQSGVYPLPPPTGAPTVFLAPRTNDGILVGEHDPAEAHATMAVVNAMIADLDASNRIANETGDDQVPAEVLRRSWHEDMFWFGPDGIGSTYTIERYQHQHQYPFRYGLTDKVFHGHVARLAEGNYACFFGWSNLSNRATGGFLGLPSGAAPSEMRVVDVYRRDGDKLAENWVFIDLAHWLKQQGLDVLTRMRQQRGLTGFGGT